MKLILNQKSNLDQTIKYFDVLKMKIILEIGYKKKSYDKFKMLNLSLTLIPLKTRNKNIKHKLLKDTPIFLSSRNFSKNKSFT